MLIFALVDKSKVGVDVIIKGDVLAEEGVNLFQGLVIL